MWFQPTSQAVSPVVPPPAKGRKVGSPSQTTDPTKPATDAVHHRYPDPIRPKSGSPPTYSSLEPAGSIPQKSWHLLPTGTTSVTWSGRPPAVPSPDQTIPSGPVLLPLDRTGSSPAYSRSPDHPAAGNEADSATPSTVFG